MAAAAAAGAGMIMLLLSAGECSFCEVGPDRSLMPFTSLSGLFAAEGGAHEFVGVVISIGSPGDGADIWMVGVRIGTVLAPIGSSGRSTK
jgi:hypothetical protein